MLERKRQNAQRSNTHTNTKSTYPPAIVHKRRRLKGRRFWWVWVSRSGKRGCIWRCLKLAVVGPGCCGFGEGSPPRSLRLAIPAQRLGLARQNLTAPANYSATPFIEGVRLLLERKTQELTAITLNANRLTSNLVKTNQPNLSSPQLRQSPVSAKSLKEKTENTTKQP